jgi:integrase
MRIKLLDGSGSIDLKYLMPDLDRYGTLRIYFRRKGRPKIWLKAPLGSKEFLDEYRAALGGKTPAPTATKTARPKAPKGSLRWLIELYYDSAAFQVELDEDSTQYARRLILDELCQEPTSDEDPTPIGMLPFRGMTKGAVRKLRDRKKHAPEAGNARVKALRQVFKFAIAEFEDVEHNPAAAVPYIKTGSQGFHTWTVEEVRQFQKRHPIGTKAHLALGLLLYLGPRRSDVVLFGRQHIRELEDISDELAELHDGRWLRFTQFKGRKRNPVTLELPILPELEEILAASPCGAMTFLETAWRKPHTRNGFGTWFRRRCNEAGLPHCSAHGVRKAGATIAAERGASPHTLMAIYGWKTLKQAELYTKAARQKVLAAAGMRLLVPGKRQAKA